MMMNEPRYIGTKIASVLATQGRRRDWLAAQLVVSPSAVSRWIGGSRSLDMATAKRISTILEIPFDLLFESPKSDELSPDGEEAA